MIFQVEVDVAVARPPSPSNTRTMFVLVHVDDDLQPFEADNEAQLTAAHLAMVRSNVVMPLATRIVSLEC